MCLSEAELGGAYLCARSSSHLDHDILYSIDVDLDALELVNVAEAGHIQFEGIECDRS
jgi:hypothetical protein